MSHYRLRRMISGAGIMAAGVAIQFIPDEFFLEKPAGYDNYKESQKVLNSLANEVVREMTAYGKLSTDLESRMQKEHEAIAKFYPIHLGTFDVYQRMKYHKSTITALVGSGLIFSGLILALTGLYKKEADT